jgi:hypothetical protein
MIKTAIENNQNLIVEGCYVPYDYKKDFDYDYLKEIKEYFLIMSTKYIINNYDNIVEFASVIENRIKDEVSQTELIIDNKKNLDKCIEYNLNYILIDDEYNIKL